MGTVEHPSWPGVNKYLDYFVPKNVSETVPLCESDFSLGPCYNLPSPYQNISSRAFFGTFRVFMFCVTVQICAILASLLFDLSKKLVTAIKVRFGSSRQLVSYPHAYTRAWMILDGIEVVLSLTSLITFIIRSYDVQDRYLEATNLILWIVEALLFLRYLLDWLAARKKTPHVVRRCEVLSLTSFSSSLVVPFLSNGWLPFNFLRAVTVTWPIRRLFEKLDFPEIYENVVLSLADFVAMIFSFAGIIFILENIGNPPGWYDSQDTNLSFFKSVWFVTVTVSTVGYGDVYPVSFLGRIAGMLFIVTGVLFFGTKTSQIAMLLQESAQGYGRFSNRRSSHVILTGKLDEVNFRDFLQEYFHREHAGHRKAGLKICALGSYLLKVDRISSRGTLPLNKLTILKGHFPTDKHRVQLSKASAIFLLSKSHPAEDGRSEDKEQLFCAFKAKLWRSNIEVFANLLDRRSLLHASGITAVCTSSLRDGLLCKSASCPGIIPLIGNLVVSANSKSLRMEDISLQLPLPRTYLEGLELEVYEVVLPDLLLNRSFAELAGLLFVDLSMLLLAVDVGDEEELRSVPRSLLRSRSPSPVSKRAGDGKRRILLFPGKDFLVQRRRVYIIAKENPQKLIDERSAASSRLSSSRKAQVAPMDQDETLLSLNGKSFGAPASAPAPPPRSLGPHSDVFVGGANFGEEEAGAASNSPESRSTRKKTKKPRDQPLKPLPKELLGVQPGVEEGGLEHSRQSGNEEEGKKRSSKNLVPEMEDGKDKTARKQSISSLQNHIVVCGMPKSIPDFLAPILGPNGQLSQETPILFIWDGKLTQENAEFLQRFSNAHHLPEPPLDPASFKKANISWAATVLLLTDIRQFNSDMEQYNPELLDAEVIFAYKYIQRKFPNVASRCICEVTENQSVQLIQEDQPAQDIYESIYLNRSFAQGRVYSSSLATSILAQSFYSPHILPIISALLSTPITNVGFDESMGFGEVPQGSKVEVIQQPVDASLQGKPYADAFLFYLNRNLLPIGLYRLEEDDGVRSEWYPCTNPSPDMEILQQDKVFLLKTC